MESFQKFNQLWIQKKIRTPLFVFIGGYCGTGKSTLARALQKKIVESTIVPTGVVRAVCKPFLKNMGDIYTCHTYQLGQFSQNDVELFANYKKQSSILSELIKELCNFAVSEMQNLIIEGNHIFPELVDAIEANLKVDVYMKTSDELQLIKNMTDIAHPRVMNEVELETAKKLHRMTVAEISQSKNMFEYNQQSLALKYVESELDVLLENIVCVGTAS
jgi:2-phosphoglycerate kinase